jgi:hypothetical protein
MLVLAFILIGGGAGCTVPAYFPLPASTGEAAAAYQTVSVILTQTAFVSDPLETGLATQPDATSQAVETMTPILTETPKPSEIPTQICEIAAAGNPIDVSIPDDTVVRPGESFVKTWHLVNAGSCTWSQDFAVVYFSGVDMGFRREDAFRSEVRPGEGVDISMDMVAPNEAGSYQGNYKLRGSSGRLFGIGPEGGSPFWVRIEVVALETPSPTVPPPTLTPTAVVFISGSALVGDGQYFDLDTGTQGSGSGDDFLLRKSRDVLEWVPQNGARVLVQGAVEPKVEDCKSALSSAEPLALGVELEGSYLCVRTDQGLPARVYLAHIDPALPSLDLQFVVWSVP